jgi:hypothetical protein
MPRQPKKREAVIPTTSLVASAVRYPGNAARIYQPRQDWQLECYRHYAICGEARFAATFFGNALSRANLTVSKPSKDGPKVQTTGTAFDLLAELFAGKDGQAQMLKGIGTHLTIAGECYLVGRVINGEDTWEVVSILEMKVNGSKWSIAYGDGMLDVILSEKDVVIRIWTPDPSRRIEADSPFKSLLPILSEIEWLTRHIFAQVSSRLAGAGILFLPQEMTFPPPPEVDGKPAEVANEADGFMLTLADNILEPIEKPESPAAKVPIIVTAPGEHIDKAKLMHFWSELDSETKGLRQEAISRFADGMDLPREQVMGMSSNSGTGGGTSNGVSHWGAWQIEEATIKMHIEPMLDVIANAITIGYLRPLLSDGDLSFVTFSTENLRLRPDRSKEAFQLWDRGVLKTEKLLTENGFSKDDMPDDQEFQRWLLWKVSTGSATPEMVHAALREMGVALPEPTGPPPKELNEARPAPSLEDHPPPKAAPEAAALLAASDALVFRALERAGNRIRQETGVKPPGVESFKMHTLFKVNGEADRFLADAWSCAPQVLEGIADVDTTIETLNAYIRSLFAEQAPHSRKRLQQWLEVSA